MVLGLRDRIAAYQVKTSRDPEPFSIKTLLLGAENLLGRMLESRRKLATEHPNALIETNYACDDYPRTNDDIGGSISSAAFLRAHDARRLSWTLADWRTSPFSVFIAEVQATSQLDDEAFEKAWRHTRFLAAGQGRFLGNAQHSTWDDQRLGDIAAILPRLVADPADRDRWPVADLLSLLGWRDPFELRHGHTFPVDAFYQSNAPTEQALQEVLSTVTSGYASLVGPPGSGKSTLLAAGLLPTPRAVVVRYLAFVPGDGQGLGRGEAFDFLHDIVKQLKKQNLGERIVPGIELPELRQQLEGLLREASERFRKDGVRTVVVVDGLDHVPREERPQHSFLCELPLPHALPDGIVFVLGTQRLDLEDIPPAVSEQAKERHRCVAVTALTREAVKRLADAAGVPDDIDRDELYTRTDGHALSTRYVIGGLLAATTSGDRQEWLHNGPAYGGDVDAFYKRAWRDIEQNAEAQRALTYVALAEGPIRLVSLDGLVGAQATDAAWGATRHLLVRDHRNAWSIFHNSFRLFLRARTGLRHGLADEGAVQRRYGELADMACKAEADDHQRWMELRYRARSGDHAAVAELARPERFRAQFIEGRDPGDIRDDISLAFAAAGILRRPELVVDLILSRHEIAMRSEALGDDVFDALVVLGERQAALGLLDAEGVTLASGKGYELVDAFLEAEEGTEARKLFEKLEPISKLLGSEALETRGDDNDVVMEWAHRALVFREPGQILASLPRLRPDERFSEFDMDAYRTQLKLAAVQWQMMRHPELAPEALMDALEIGSEHRGRLLYHAARAAFETERDRLATGRLEALLSIVSEVGPGVRREAARIAMRLGLSELAAAFLENVASPTLAGRNFSYGGEDLGWAVRQIVTHASLAAQLGRPPAAGATPESHLLATFQRRLEILGRLLGEGRGGRQPSVEPLQAFGELLTFLQHAEGEESNDSERWALDKVMGQTVAAIVSAAAVLGQDAFSRFTDEMDARLAGDPGRLGRSQVRRAYAIEAFRHDADTARAELRVGYQPGKESSPAEQLAEAARTAQALVVFGLEEKARSLLVQMHADGLGYGRPAKKDPQYVVWRDLFARACEEDPGGRPDRLRFFGRLLAGMAETEGDGAGRRIVGVFLDQAAQAGPAWARCAADAVEQIGLAPWSGLVEGLLTGVLKHRPGLAAAAGVIFGRVALPFASDSDGNAYPDLIRAVPKDQLEALVQHAVACLEADSHPTKRIIFLEDVVEAAADRGFAFGGKSLARWRAELPPPRSGSSPEDPFFLVRTLDEITSVLQHVGDGTSSWGAVRAFARIAPRSDYDAAKGAYDANEVLHKDERAIETMAQAAVAAGRGADAASCLARLRELAEEKGGWGDGWREKTKQRYHRLNVLLGGEAARRAAFAAFVDDLANRREYMDYLLPDLCDVIELLSPRPTWAETWARLQSQLSHFREHLRGKDLGPLTEVGQGDEHTLADILFRAIDTTSIELTKMVRGAAVELVQVPGGAAVVAALLPRLWQAGAYHALEAPQIAWECRDALPVREAVLAFLDEMLDSDDLAVRRTAMYLASGWGQQPAIKNGDLPAIYELTLPASLRADRFKPPSGTSSISSGLYTEDVNGWTWPLGAALELTVTATGLALANLRARAAQIMTRLGGTAAFGPEAGERQEQLLRRLSLHSTYRKLAVSAAFQAGREVVGELVAAEAFDPRALPFILSEVGAFPSKVSTLPHEPRPLGVPKAEMDDSYRSDDSRSWRASVEQDAVRPTIAGHLVLAATAIHERRHFREQWCVEQYHGPDTGGTADRLSQQLRRLPRALVLDELHPLYEGLAPGAVVHPEADISGSIGFYMVALCPRVTAKLGWRPDPRHLFTYRDGNDQVVAQTLCWRDGGVRSREPDDAVFRSGCVLVVRKDRADEMRPYLSAANVSTAWRATQVIGEENRAVTSASRSDPPPGDGAI